MSSRRSRRRRTSSTIFLLREDSRLRKKIPTITRPDPAYAATLQQGDREVPGKEDEAQVTATKTGTQATDVDADRHESELVPEGTVAPHQVTAESSDPHTSLRAPVSARALSPTRKIDIRVNALERQEAALETCGVDQHMWCVPPCAVQSKAGNCRRSSPQSRRSDALETRSGRPVHLWQ